MTTDYNAFKDTDGKAVFPASVNEILEREFDLESEIESRAGFGNQVFYYPRGEAVIKRLDEAFGSCWSFCVKEYFKDVMDDTTIVVLGELIINHPSYPLRVVQQFAGKQIAKNRNGGIVNIANDYKSAASLSLRKCAMQIGIGLYLQKGLPDEDLQEYNAASSSTKSNSNSAKESSEGSREASSSSTYKGPEASDNPATEKQINFVKSLYSKKGITEEVDFENLTAKQASDFISAWKGMPDASSSSKGEAAKPASKPAPKAVESKAPEKAAPEEKVAPEDESENLKKLRKIAAELIGQDDDYDPTVDKFMLHIYKTNFSKELSSVHSISEEELASLISTIEDEE